MQFRSDFTKEELINDSDPLFNACHPLGKIQALSDLFFSMSAEGKRYLSTNALNGISGILGDAIKEIKLLIEVSNEQFLKVFDENKKFKIRITELENLASRNELKTIINIERSQKGKKNIDN